MAANIQDDFNGTLAAQSARICLLLGLDHPMLILKIVSANIFFPLGDDWSGAVKLVLGNWQSSTGGAGTMNLSCIVPASVTFDPFIHHKE